MIKFIYSPEVEGKAQLVERWNTPEFSAYRDEIISAISSNEDLPFNLPTIKVRWHNHEYELLDLQGIDLREMEIGPMDFSYCCLNQADLTGCKFNSTYLQYSTFVAAKLDGCQFEAVQGSPINARRASMAGAAFKNSFFMYSCLNGVSMSGASFFNTDFSCSDLRGVASPPPFNNNSCITDTSLEEDDSGAMVQRVPVTGDARAARLFDRYRAVFDKYRMDQDSVVHGSAHSRTQDAVLEFIEKICILNGRLYIGKDDVLLLKKTISENRQPGRVRYIYRILDGNLPYLSPPAAQKADVAKAKKQRVAQNKRAAHGGRFLATPPIAAQKANGAKPKRQRVNQNKRVIDAC